ncbi:MAG: phosphoglucosamine mutase [Gammaproteobacteria bacterium]|nr:phosphoglucosamine mutase [Gammaproteobacteria bacterium]
MRRPVTADERLFGTDGIRGRVGTDPITPSFAYHLGRTLAAHALTPNALVYVGRDTRASSLELETYLAHGFVDGGAQVASLGVLPTPGISYCTKESPADFGIVITASHNPHEYNGFKLFGSDGAKLDDPVEHQIEQWLLNSDRKKPARDLEALDPDHRASDSYLKMLTASATQIGHNGLRIVVDCAHGATTTTAAQIFGHLCNDLHFIGNAPNGVNINKDVGSTSLSAVQRSVMELKADLGIAFDGDGDRVLFVDDHGDLVGGDQVLYLLAKRHLTSDASEDGVVGTIMSNHGLQIALDKIGIPFIRADVGDKNVYDELKSRQWRLGGEPSGHLIWRDIAETGDGILIGLCVIDVIHRERSSLRQLVASVSMLPQAERNVHSPKPHDSLQKTEVKELITQFRTLVASEGRLLVRASGTEPLIRVMVEHQVATTANEFADTLASSISAAI